MTTASAEAQAALAVALEAAEAARAVTRRWFRADFEVIDKADESPVSIADREAEGALRGVLARLRPADGIVGEEYGPEREGADLLWVVDPIDGTRKFITGSPIFGTLIALLREGRPIFGLIDMPILGERWIGRAGQPTLFQDAAGEHPARTRACAALEQADLFVSSPDMFKGESLTAFERTRRAVKRTTYGHDCQAYGLIASGWADLVVEGSLELYDYAALVPVVEGAGGRMADWSGEPLGLESDGRVVALGDPARLDELLAHLGA